MKKQFTKLLLACFCFAGSFNALHAQLYVTYDFNSATATAAPVGYNQPNVGTYYRNATGSTISFGTTSCDGFSKSAPTSSSVFYFVAVKDVKDITIRGAGTGSNRTFSALATSATLNGTYTNVTVNSSSTMTTSGTCGVMNVVPAAVIPAGTYMRFTISGNIDVTSIVFNFVPTGTPPTITTDVIIPGKNFASISGTVTPGTMPLQSSGVIWSTVNTPMDTTLATKTRNYPSATGSYNNSATGLTPSTSYFGRAYVVDLAGNVYYGAIVPFTTLAATAPTLTTVAITNNLPYKANSGGQNIDSGGLSVSQKGVCWSTAPNPTIASSITAEGPYGNNFSSLLRVLQPTTTYYVRAYATNAVGTGYGNEISFTTPAPAPALIANPLTMNFGNVPVNAQPPVFSYTLTGFDLTPASGNITLTPPAGYTLSTQPNTGFTSPLVLPYTGGALPVKTIYIKLATSSYGTYNGNIIHTGGGVASNNADTVKITGAIIPDPNVTTNLGTDFWTGFGYQEKMNQKAGNSGETKLSLYVSVPAGSQPAVINVEMPGIAGYATFQQNITVAPGTVKEITGFPTGDAANAMNLSGMPDSRLYYTGVSSRGIHVYSTNGVPVSVWMHSYTSGNTAAGAMLFPTNTWNSEYTVLAYGGQPNASPYYGGFTNNSNPNSFFFVVANEDNTPIWFTPSQDILDSSTASIFTEGHAAANVKYQKGVTYGPIILNKGQVFNAMGFIQGSGNSANGLDLSGSKVRTNCDKRIAVFGGNGRCLINSSTCNANSGSDHLIQQMFPKVAWGTKYITVPTKTMEYNLYRVNVDDPTTRVWINNPAHTTQLTGLINNLYYEFASNQSLLIESDKPITVTQFIVAGGCANAQGSKGQGDPEMIILSPVQQSINNATVYSAAMKGPAASYNGHYINVVIRKGGIPSFRLDGVAVADTGINQATANAGTCYNTGGSISMANAFVKHPYDTNFYVAKLRVTPGVAHRLSSDSTFNAIAYGMGDGESYGYSAGTNIKDLSRPLFLDNPYLPNNTNNTACKNNLVYLKAVLPYPPSQIDSIRWNMGSISGVSPQANITLYNPAADSTFVQDGVSYFVYKNPVAYTFNAAGSYQITGLIGGTFASNCGSTSPFNFNINIADPGFADFSISYNPCVSDTVRFTDASDGNGFPIVKWYWDFGDNTKDTINQNPWHLYASASIYNIKLRAINNIGCYADTTLQLNMISNLEAKFGVRDTICAKSTVTFTDSSTGSTPIVRWIWNYGDGKIDTLTTNAAVTHVYNTAGQYTVSLQVSTAAGCKNTFTKIIDVRPLPFASFNMPAGICLPSGATQFTNLSTISDATALAYGWTFGDGGISSVKDPLHIYTSTGPFNVNLVVTSVYGCQKDTTRILSNVFAQPTAGITVAPQACLKDTVQFTDNSNGQGNTVVKWTWNFGDGATDTLKNPKHFYATAGTYNVWLVVVTDKGCISDTARTTVTVNPLPTPNFTFSALRCAQQPVTFTDQSSANGGASLAAWSYTMGNSTIKNFIAAPAPFAENYTTAGTYNVKLTVVDNKGCKADTTKQVIINPNPLVGFVIPKICMGDLNTQFTDTSSISDGTQGTFVYAWNFGDANATAGNPNTSGVKNPTHTFTAVANYDVSLTITTANGCQSSITQQVKVNPLPFADFNLPGGICLPSGKAQFNDISTISDGTQSAFVYQWTFGDGGSSTLKNPQHTYTGVGPFNIKLQVTSGAGCKKDTTKTLSNIYPQPIANFTPTPTEVCLGDSIRFVDNSDGLTSQVVAWAWNFKDGKTDTVKNPVHTFTKAGNYTVSLTITNAQGCVSNTANVPVTINAYPVVTGGSPVFVLQGNSVTLQPTVTGQILDYKWTPALYLNNDTVKNPFCTPQNDILYRLTVTGKGGCKASDTLRVNLFRTPAIPNAFSPNGDGINDTWQIGHISTYPGATVDVYNRYGQLVFSSQGYKTEWDGKYNGNVLPVGVYYYIVNPKNGLKPIAGSLTILR